MGKLTKVDIKKKLILEALEKSMGIITTACKEVGISRQYFYELYNKDSKFAEAVDALDNYVIDFAESKLHQKINEGDTTAIIFYLKTKGKKRGYIERPEISVEAQNIQINIIEKSGD